MNVAGRTPVTVDPVTLVLMARTTPGLAEYIQGRRLRGIPAAGRRVWRLES